MSRFCAFIAILLAVRLADALSVTIVQGTSISRPAGSNLLLTCLLTLNPGESGSSLQLTRSRSRLGARNISVSLQTATDSNALRKTKPRHKRQIGNSVSIAWYRRGAADERIGSSNTDRVHVELDAAEKKLKLIFTKLRDVDTSAYVCSAKLNSQTAEQSVTVTVSQPTQISKCDENQDVKLNASSAIVCEASGSPTPTRTWFLHRTDSDVETLGRFSGSTVRIGNSTATISDRGINFERVLPSDAGRYEVRFEIEAIGDIQNRFINVRVTEPPVIKDAKAGKKALQNGDVDLQCDTVGVPKPTIRWFRKEDPSQELTAQLSERYEVNGEGRLKIRQLQAEDTGEYQCLASNSAGDATAWVVVEVKTVPEIIILPTYQTSLVKKAVEIRCVASGSAPLSVDIYKLDYQTGSMIELSQLSQNSARGITVQTSMPTRSDVPECDVRIRHCQQRTAHISTAEPSDTANYTCVAKNDAGSVNKTTTLEIFYGPTVDKSVTRMYGYDDIPVNLSCVAHGRPVPEFLWQKVGRRTSTIATVSYLNTQSAEQQVRLIGDSRNYRVIVEYFPIYTVCNLEITVNSARNEQALFGNYRCSVTSRGADNNDSHSVEFLMGGPPKAPKNCSVTISTASYVRMNVEPPSQTGGFALTGYVVNFRLRNADGSLSSTSSDPSSFKMGETIEMRGLKPQTEYRFQVAAKNRIGVGAQTECVHTTPDVGPPSPPEITSLRLSSASTSYELTWNLENDGGLPISQYLVRVRQKSNSTSRDSDIEKRIASGATSIVIDSLSPGTAYEAELTAINARGASAPSVFQFETRPNASVAIAAVKETTIFVLSKWVTIGIIVACALVTLVAIDITCYYWKSCGFTHTCCIMCCNRDKRQTKTQYNFEAAERRYLMTLERSKEHSRATTPIAGVSPSVERKDSPFAPSNAGAYQPNSIKQTELLVIERHGDIGTIAIPHDSNNNSNNNGSSNNNNGVGGFAAAQIHAAPLHSVGNGSAITGNNYYA